LSWEAIFSPKAALSLSRMGKSDSKRIIKKLKNSLDDPKRFFKSLSNQDDLKMRIGDYRIIAKLLHSQKTILVLGIGLRKSIYKKK
jgi:mRNA interferase RelE/StbE